MATITNPEIRKMKTTDLIPAKYNPRTIDDKALNGLNNSMEKFGIVEPIIWNKRTKNVVGGHQRLKILLSHNIEEVDVVIVDLPEDEEKALNIALNNPHIQGEFNEGLQELLGEIRNNNNALFLDLNLDELLEDTKDISERYSKKIETPIYKITGAMPDIKDLYKDVRTKELLEKIDKAQIDPTIKEFLKLAAQRHTVFHYENIAEYYAHQSPEVQELMEDCTLVIIDYNRAIEQGFIDFAKNCLDGVHKDED
jgi:hypothetical protein